jgi:hypothetical protein
MVDVSSRYFDYCSNSYYGTCAMGNFLQASWVQYKKKASLQLNVGLGMSKDRKFGCHAGDPR